MFGTVNWPDVAIGAGLALGLALVVAQLTARAVGLALGTVTGDAELYFGEASKAFLTHQLEVEAMERASLARSEERSRSARLVSRSKAATADGETEADGRL